MGRKINVGILLVLIFFIILALSFYYPIFLGKIPFNGNLLVAFWSPWKYLQWPGFPTGVPFKFMGVDEAREFFPLLDFTHNAISAGFIPLWNPYNFSGYPHLANWASAVFYPLHVVFFLLDKIQSFIFLKVSAIILSGFFTYLYLLSIKLDRRSSFFGGMAFAFSATLLVWGAEIWQAVHATIWLPLILFSIEKIISTKKLTYSILGGFGVAASIMAGYIQPTIYVLIMVLTYSIFRTRRTILPIIFMFVLGFGLSAIHTLPAIEAFLLSPRRDLALTDVNISFLLPAWHMVTFFAPDIFGHVATQNWFLHRPGQYYESMIFVGAVPVIVSSFALFSRKMRWHVLFFLIWGVLSLTTVIDLPTSRLIYQLHVPFLSTAIPIRIILVVSFCVAVLSAIGLSHFLQSTIKEKKRLLLSLLPLITIYVLIGIWVLTSFLQKTDIVGFPPNWSTISLRNLVVPLVIFVLTTTILTIGILIPRFRNHCFLLLVVLTLTHSFLFAHKYFAFSDSKLVYPPHSLISYLKEQNGVARYFGYGEAYLSNNFATIYKIYSSDGYDPVNVKRYNEFLSSANTGDLRGIASRSDALIPTADLNPLEDTNVLRLRILDLLGVKFVGFHVSETNRDKVKVLESDRFKLVWQEDGFMVFENKKAFDRAFLVPEAIFIDSKEEALKKIYDPSIDLSQKVIITEEIKIEKGSGVPTDSVDIIAYTPNKVVVKASTNMTQLLVLSDAYYPGWQASIDGVSTKIYPAYHALRAVVIPKGQHEVVFEYKPSSFLWGVIVSVASLLMILCILLINKLQLKKIRL